MYSNNLVCVEILSELNKKMSYFGIKPDC